MKKINQLISRSKTESERAIAQFISTEERLKKENEQVEHAIKLIDEKATELEQARVEGERMINENSGIMYRIGQIVRGDEQVQKGGR